MKEVSIKFLELPHLRLGKLCLPLQNDVGLTMRVPEHALQIRTGNQIAIAPRFDPAACEQFRQYIQYGCVTPAIWFTFEPFQQTLERGPDALTRVGLNECQLFLFRFRQVVVKSVLHALQALGKIILHVHVPTQHCQVRIRTGDQLMKAADDSGLSIACAYLEWSASNEELRCAQQILHALLQ